MAREFPELDEHGKRRIEEVLKRAAEDFRFREHLLKNPETALEGFDLSPDERKALISLRRVGLEEWGVDVRQFRAFLRDNGQKVSPLEIAIDSMRAEE